MRAWRAFLSALLLVAAPASARAAEPLLVDITRHVIAITTGFVGTSVVLFGTTDGPGDVVVVVRGPDRRIIVRQKRHLAGIWINARSVIFPSAPGYYAVASNRALAEVAPSALRRSLQIGVDALSLEPEDPGTKADEARLFRLALLGAQQQDRLYNEDARGVSFIGDRLFRVTLTFPADVPVGDYRVEVLLLRGGKVIATQTMPLAVSELGVAADITSFATNQPVLYGISAVLGAALIGWLASLPFRNA